MKCRTLRAKAQGRRGGRISGCARPSVACDEWLFRGGQGEFDGDSRSYAQVALEFDGTAEGGDELVDNGKAETNAGVGMA